MSYNDFSEGSPPIGILVMPGKEVPIGSVIRFTGQTDWLTVQTKIVLAVIKLILEPAANLNAIFWGDGEISFIKERMNILTQQYAICYEMLSAFFIAFYVRGI